MPESQNGRIYYPDSRAILVDRLYKAIDPHLDQQPTSLWSKFFQRPKRILMREEDLAIVVSSIPGLSDHAIMDPSQVHCEVSEGRVSIDPCGLLGAEFGEASGVLNDYFLDLRELHPRAQYSVKT